MTVAAKTNESCRTKLKKSSSIAEEVPCAGGFFDQELWYGPTFVNISLSASDDNGGTAERLPITGNWQLGNIKTVYMTVLIFVYIITVLREREDI